MYSQNHLDLCCVHARAAAEQEEREGAWELEGPEDSVKQVQNGDDVSP